MKINSQRFHNKNVHIPWDFFMYRAKNKVQYKALLNIIIISMMHI